MKIIKPQTLSLLTRPFEFRRQFWLGVSVMAFLPIGEDPILLPETDMWALAAAELPADQALDAAIPKRRPEFLAAAIAFSPDGAPVNGLQAGIQLGGLRKMVNVIGDRQFRGTSVSAITPFVSMPIDAAHAYGGPDFAENPKGKGSKPVDGGEIFDAPNILDPALGPEGVRSPAGYFAVDQMAPSRLKFAGTHDQAWLENDFPGFAPDIDWRFFNIAPPDQHLPGPLTGTEPYAFKDLHPTKPVLQGRLPGMAPRAFLVRKGAPDGFEEIALALTTIWFFPHCERLILIHHGQARLMEEDASDIARIVIGADPQNALRPPSDFQAVMTLRADPKEGAMYALDDSQLVPAAWLAPAEDSAEDDEPTMAIVAARHRRAAEAAHAENVAKLIDKGVDPAKLPPMPPAEAKQPKPGFADLAKIATAAKAEAEQKQAEMASLAETKKAQAAARMAKAGMSQAEIDAKLNAKPKGPPTFSAAARKAQISKQLEKIPQDQRAKMNLAATFAGLDMAEQQIRMAYRLSAHAQDPADAAPAERSAEIRRLVQADSAAARALYDLHGADLSGLDLAGIDLSGVCLDGANLAKVNLSRATLTNAVLAHANLADAKLDRADLTGANLGRANLTGASLRRAQLEGAVLAGANLTDANFDRADLEKADLSDAILTRVNFQDVHAPEILCMKLDMRSINATGMKLDKAKFLECNLSAANFSEAALEKAVFLDCVLRDTDFSRAQMPKAVFVKNCDLSFALFIGTNLREANLREMKLCGAVLAGADMRKADFSTADMTGAVLPNARADDARFVATNLAGADLRGGSFARADLARADLRGADMTNMSVYEANMPRVKLDTNSKRAGMLRTRLRYLPAYKPPEPVA
jgi:uncharacterized protein YjbI with pentapeptide repeats